MNTLGGFSRMNLLHLMVMGQTELICLWMQKHVKASRDFFLSNLVQTQLRTDLTENIPAVKQCLFHCLRLSSKRRWKIKGCEVNLRLNVKFWGRLLTRERTCVYVAVMWSNPHSDGIWDTKRDQMWFLFGTIWGLNPQSMAPVFTGVS